MYTTNALLSHPMVSPVMQPTLGGLPPLLIMVGGGEVLRDEQIYVAHKCANPARYPPPGLDDAGLAQLKQYKPTDVQLQVWDDLCHVAPTLSFTRPAKHMYRAVAQFGAWALARAQQTEIEILDDDDISMISSSASDSDKEENQTENNAAGSPPELVGKAGMPLPPFKKHMIRQKISTRGVVSELAPESELDGCVMKPEEVGVVRPTPVRRWLDTKATFDKKFSSTKAKVHKSIIKDLADGYMDFGEGEQPPPTALAGRRKASDELVDRKKTKSIGLALWSLWGSKHDETTTKREKRADSDAVAAGRTSQQTRESQTSPRGGEGARSFEDIEHQDPAPLGSPTGSRRRFVRDEHQTEEEEETPASTQVQDSQTTAATAVEETTPVAALIEKRREQEKHNEQVAAAADGGNHLSPDFVPGGTGVAGKRPFLDGIALPFSLGKKDAETASMVTLMSGADSRPISPMPQLNRSDTDATTDGLMVNGNGISASEASTQVPAENESTRPPLDTFVTAAEDLPLAKGKGKEVVRGGLEQTA